MQTGSGPVSGHGSKNHTDVSEYLGIPYGTAERFGAPQKFNGTTPLSGSAFVSFPFVLWDGILS